jgi:fructose-1,6-bisphosphatase/inositol monophosphatase family enzyme
MTPKHPTPIIDADAEQAARNRIAQRPQADVIIVEEID